MIEQILSDFYRIKIPLPGSPLKEINSYLIKGKERHLLIDTGMNREECRIAMLSALKSLEVELNKTDIFITHLHADHLGLVEHLATKTSSVYLNEREVALLGAVRGMLNERFRTIYDYYLASGFPETELEKAVENHPGLRFRPSLEIPFHELRDGDRLKVGRYDFECIATPGHSPGHMCLYEAREKILAAGDHILFDITPNITRWPEFDNPLKDYFESLKKVRRLDVNLVLPGHRNMMKDHRKRIDELLKHYEERLEEMLSALRQGAETAWEVAALISWDIQAGNWEKFPSIQKWFAIGETVAHLNFLEAEGKVKTETKDKKRVYSLVVS